MNSTKQKMKFPKYGKEAPFEDPVVRCMECRQLVYVAHLAHHGSCPCGSKRMKDVRNLNEKEYEAVRKQFPKFGKVFAPMEGTDGILKTD